MSGETDALADDASATTQARRWLELASAAERRGDLEEAEASYRKAVAIFRPLVDAGVEGHDLNLAWTLGTLGPVLKNLLRGEEAEEALEEALTIFERHAQLRPRPEMYDHVATCLHNLGNVLRQLGRLREAEERIRAALTIMRRLAKAQPEIYEADVAKALLNLGLVLQDLRRLDEAETAEREALTIYRSLAKTRSTVHEPDVARSLNNLAITLHHLRRPEEADGAYREALKIYRRLAKSRPEVYQSDVAMILDNLANMLREFRRLKEARTYLQEALDIRRPLAAARHGRHESLLANALMNFGIVLHQLHELEDAEVALREAAEIRRREAEANPGFFGGIYAKTLMNLGIVLHARGRLEESKVAYEEALDIQRALAGAGPEVHEPHLTITLDKFGNLLQDLGRIAEAEDAYKEAFTRLRAYDLPDYRLTVLSDWGRLLLQQKQWEKAADTLHNAVQQIELLRTEILTLDRRLTILRENVGIFESLVVCLMKLGRHLEALEVAEQGKSRTLIDLLMLRDLRPRNASDDATREYEQMLFRARALEDELRRTEEESSAGGPGGPEDERGLKREELARTTAQLRAIAGTIGQHDPDFLPHASPLTRDDIIALARKAAATLVLFRVTTAGSYVFLVFPDGEPDVVEVSDLTTPALSDIVESWMLRYSGYQEAAATDRDAMASRAQWLDGMDETLAHLYRTLLQPVHDTLRRRGVRDVVFVPNRGLAILPLHACWWEENGSRRYLVDEFNIRYAPSLSVFARCLERERLGRDGDTMLAIANPEPPGNLAFAEWECDEIDRLVGSGRCLILRRKDATRAEVARWADSQHWLHFSCHGQYRLDAPLDSPLQLAGGESLTMGEIFENVYLPQTSLVSLSACETGLVDFRDVADEHYGLPTAFLYAGVPTVFASLWMVNDLSTALVMTKAYDGVITDKKDKADALRDAQLWVRDLTAADIVGLLQGRGSHLAPVRRHYEDAYDPGDRPFAHPYWWAAFQCVGA